jgi:hypothetical protein
MSNPATSRLATEPICIAPTAGAASVGALALALAQSQAPRRRSRTAAPCAETHRIFSLASMSGSTGVVGMLPPSANHSLQLCSRKPSCS